MGVTGIWLPLRVRVGWLLYSLLNGVITVTDDFCADTCILFESSQLSSWVKYCCRFSAALVMLGSEEVIVRSSAYDAIDTLGCRGVGRSWRKRFQDRDDRRDLPHGWDGICSQGQVEYFC